ncbi:MAG: hypothetical protein GQ574_19515 [Crocinitomix sp.]|nr:hypothetical protein [Crocinitomix sp.]
MAWEKERMIPFGKVISIVTDFDVWVMRMNKLIYGFDYAANKIVWQIEVNDSSSNVNKEILKAGDYVIGSYFADKKSNKVWFFALAPLTGKIVWSKKIDKSCVSGNSSQPGYFFSNENFLFSQDRSGTKANYIIDSRTGETLFVKEAIGFNKIFESGNDILFLHHVSAQLYKHPKKVTAISKSEKILEDHYISNAYTLNDKLYLFGRPKEQEEKQYKILELDNDSYEVLRTYDLDKNGKYRGAQMLAIENGVVILYGDGIPLQLIDLNRPEKNWKNEEAKDTLIHTKNGLLTSECFDDNILSLSKDEGVLTDSGIAFKSQYFSSGNYIVTNVSKAGSFAEQELAIYVWKDKAEESEISMASIACELQNIKDLIDFEPPKKVTKKEQLKNALIKVNNAADFEAFHSELKGIYKIKKINAKVITYIENHFFTDNIDGFLNLSGAKKALETSLTYHEILSEGSDDLLFPAIFLGSESSGSYFYLMLESGKIISPHHDSLKEESYSLFSDEMTMTAFKNKLVKQFSVYDIDQLLLLQERTKGFELDRENRKKIIAIASEVFSIETKQVVSFVGKHPSLEFLLNVLSED